MHNTVAPYILRVIFKGYEDVGFSAAFAKTQHGVGFERSLQIADGPLDFLGIGGDKLTMANQRESLFLNQ